MPAQPGEQLNIAAARLGITTAALRMRVRRGLVPAYKQDGRWYIGAPDVRTAQEAAHESAQPVQESEQPAQHADLVAHLQAEVTYLRARLEEALALAAREQELRRGEMPLQLGVGSAESPLSKPETAPSSTTTPAAAKPRPWWRVW